MCSSQWARLGRWDGMSWGGVHNKMLLWSLAVVCSLVSGLGSELGTRRGRRPGADRQHYEVADYEINIGFEEFKELYGGGGSVECVCQLDPRPGLTLQPRTDGVPRQPQG